MPAQPVSAIAAKCRLHEDSSGGRMGRAVSISSSSSLSAAAKGLEYFTFCRECCAGFFFSDLLCFALSFWSRCLRGDLGILSSAMTAPRRAMPTSCVAAVDQWLVRVCSWCGARRSCTLAWVALCALCANAGGFASAGSVSGRNSYST